jgi:pimeloyl-ACP methyl ester carboxylesterase
MPESRYRVVAEGVMYAQVNGARLFFDVEGPKWIPDGRQMLERPTLILLHGGPGFDHSGYKPDFARLSDVAQIVYLDHRGQGRSEKGTPETWNLDQWADDVRGLCDVLGIEKPVVMGNSFGGMVAMAYAARHPDHPGRLIFSSTSARQNLDRIVDRFGDVGGSDVASLARAFWESPSPETLAPYARSAFPVYTRSGNLGDPDANARTIWSLDVLFHFAGGENTTMNLLPGLGQITCPTLLLAGDLDPVCPIEDALEIADAVPPEHLRFERFAECGHGVYRDDPERGFGVIRSFLEDARTSA